MGNRSRYLAFAATAAGAAALARRRRHARLNAAAEAMQQAVMPTHAVEAPAEWTMPPDAGHAPGKRHLSRHEARQRRRALVRYERKHRPLPRD